MRKLSESRPATGALRTIVTTVAISAVVVLGLFIVLVSLAVVSCASSNSCLSF